MSVMLFMHIEFRECGEDGTIIRNRLLSGSEGAVSATFGTYSSRMSDDANAELQLTSVVAKHRHPSPTVSSFISIFHEEHFPQNAYICVRIFQIFKSSIF